MNASMLDEVQVPEEKQRLYLCPCCVLTFVHQATFVSHCEAMKVKIDAAIASSKLERKKK